MNYLVSEYYLNRGFKTRDIEKARLYELICAEEGTSRKRMNQKLRLRPNNVSDSVQQLTEDELVYEDAEVKIQGKGRPEVILHPRFDRLVAISVGVSSNTLTADLIDMEGKSIWQKSLPVPDDADNTVFLESLTRLIIELEYCITKKQILVGIGVAVPGIVSANGTRWVFNSRWPEVSNLDFSKLSVRFKVPVRLYRFLDSQLNALIFRNVSINDSSIILVHWGYGIGAAYCINGKIPLLAAGSISEIGHIKIVPPKDAALCRCGERGCLETISSGWALQKHLGSVLGVFPSDEKELGRLMASRDFSGDPVIEKAVESVACVIDNTHRVFPADRVIVYGPFVGNQFIRKTLVEKIREKLPWYSKPSVEIEIITGDFEDITALGCCADFFKARLIEMLVFHGMDNN
ncbi:ROK family protein [Treponema parvum]|uniref:ROK family protein n=1 Tax=Treponema parvum TaxID=138851 RepID=A0A975ID69_9SPIR|nr:ROK family protein [Treponema parvum]QTQ12645.1 ROK family protein [Treponema parvum]QTQ15378.1 ROK family protein [Treponema parvum]